MSGPHHRLPLFPLSNCFTLIAMYWLIPGTDSNVIYTSKKFLFYNRSRINYYKLAPLYLLVSIIVNTVAVMYVPNLTIFIKWYIQFRADLSINLLWTFLVQRLFIV